MNKKVFKLKIKQFKNLIGDSIDQYFNYNAKKLKAFIRTQYTVIL